MLFQGSCGLIIYWGENWSSAFGELDAAAMGNRFNLLTLG
jgi:hypothetical protein